jgi:hypothetical protein
MKRSRLPRSPIEASSVGMLVAHWSRYKYYRPRFEPQRVFRTVSRTSVEQAADCTFSTHSSCMALLGEGGLCSPVDLHLKLSFGCQLHFCLRSRRNVACMRNKLHSFFGRALLVWMESRISVALGPDWVVGPGCISRISRPVGRPRSKGLERRTHRPSRSWFVWRDAIARSLAVSGTRTAGRRKGGHSGISLVGPNPPNYGI